MGSSTDKFKLAPKPTVILVIGRSEPKRNSNWRQKSSLYSTVCAKPIDQPTVTQSIDVQADRTGASYYYGAEANAEQSGENPFIDNDAPYSVENENAAVHIPLSTMPQ